MDKKQVIKLFTFVFSLILFIFCMLCMINGNYMWAGIIVIFGCAFFGFSLSDIIGEIK